MVHHSKEWMQKKIDERQDKINNRQDKTDSRQDKVNQYQTSALIVYGLMLFGILTMLAVASYLKCW
jgi:hypothetical protein